jgi:hypothetical protein
MPERFDAMLLQEKTYSSIASVPLVARHHHTLTGKKVLSALQCAVTWVCVWVWIGVGRSRQRRALRRLDNRLLDDIGLTRQQANRETSKLFWQE